MLPLHSSSTTSPTTSSSNVVTQSKVADVLNFSVFLPWSDACQLFLPFCLRLLSLYCHGHQKLFMITKYVLMALWRCGSSPESDQAPFNILSSTDLKNIWQKWNESLRWEHFFQVEVFLEFVKVKLTSVTRMHTVLEPTFLILGNNYRAFSLVLSQ